MTDSAPKPALQFWFNAWKTCLQDVLAQISGKPAPCEAVFQALAANDPDLRYTIVAAGTVQGEMSLRLSQSSGLRLARLFVGEPEPSPAPDTSVAVTNEDREALEELLRQIAGLAATALGATVGGQLQLQLSRAEAPWAWTSDHVATLRMLKESDKETHVEISLEIRISPALATSCAAASKGASAGAQATDPQNTDSSSAAALTSDSDPPAAGYRRLMDVGLGVKLRFGTRRMLLRDVLALSSGLVVELDNQLNSPVELLLDERIIARGEVVVIDGKYGLRVTEVLDPSSAASPP